MDIRNDYKSIEDLLSRLVQYASVFHEFNHERWPHLKNLEDYSAVYQFPSDVRFPLENIYGDGRDLAVFMASRLTQFNDPTLFPTLKSFVDSFDGTWIDQIEALNEQSQKAQTIASNLSNCPWAIEQMIGLFNQQVSLLGDVRQTINALKDSEIYQFESGAAQMSKPSKERQPHVTVALIGAAATIIAAVISVLGAFSASNSKAKAAEIASGIVPIGTIAAFSGDAGNAGKEFDDHGWVLCHGQELKRKDYPELAKVLDDAWGRASDPASDFRVPDLRGQFLRGVDQTQLHDKGPRAPIGRGVGSKQDDSTRLTESRITLEKNIEFLGLTVVDDDGLSPVGGSMKRYFVPSGTERSTDSIVLQANTKAPMKISGGGEETRPVNAAVFWMIRAK